MSSSDSLYEAIESFINKKKLYNFEGDSGLKNLEIIVKTLGYKESNFRFGSLIETFLSDNPGAVSNLIDWIKEQNIPEWLENVDSELTEEEEED